MPGFQVSERKIRRMVRHEGLDGYVETSAKKGGPDVDRVFHEAVRIILGGQAADGEQQAANVEQIGCVLL